MLSNLAYLALKKGILKWDNLHYVRVLDKFVNV